MPFVADAAVFALAYAVTGVLRRYPWAIAVILVVLWVGMLLVHRDRVQLLTVSLGLAVAGPVYESLLTWTGAFHYTVTPLVLRDPVWLPLLYLNAGILATSAARAMLTVRQPSPRPAASPHRAS